MYPGGQLVAVKTRVTPALEHLMVAALVGVTFGVGFGVLLGVAVAFGVGVGATNFGSLIVFNNGADSMESLSVAILKVTSFPKLTSSSLNLK